jgi:hypothetical protein
MMDLSFWVRCIYEYIYEYPTKMDEVPYCYFLKGKYVLKVGHI